MKLLVISNGHGEDLIAVKIIRQLRQIIPELEIAGLPMVGKGFAYSQAQITIASEVKSLPSGGFIYMDQKQLWQDVRSGLMGLTWRQYQAAKTWANQGAYLLAVGDIVPLFFAWLSGANYFFVGTAKSEYYLRSEDGWLNNRSLIQRLWTSDYYPWEYWLMNNVRCWGVFPRDSLTATRLVQADICSYDLGNPMMDDLSPNSAIEDGDTSLKVLLLPGSRIPEALENWQLIVESINSILQVYDSPVIFLAAIAPSLSLADFKSCLVEDHWQPLGIESCKIKITDSHSICLSKNQGTLILSQNAYAQCLDYCDICVAMAGTATEQFVGLGKPAIAFAGKGPQYNKKFAHKQKRLLGVSLQLVNKPADVGQKIQELLSNQHIMQKIAINGQKRLGKGGASLRIAQFISQKIA